MGDKVCIRSASYFKLLQEVRMCTYKRKFNIYSTHGIASTCVFCFRKEVSVPQPHLFNLHVATSPLHYTTSSDYVKN